MKIIHVNFDGTHGGATIAAKRINSGLQEMGINSEMWVARSPGIAEGIHCIKSRFFQKLDSLKNIIIYRVAEFMKFGSDRSYNLIPSRIVHQLNVSDADVVHLHWINAEMVSIAQLAKIKKPVVWTLHDMWAFCGAEHYTTEKRYINGYLPTPNEMCDPTMNCSFDIDRWVFNRKQKHWGNWQPHIVTPSHWLKQCAEESLLFKDLKVSLIQYCLELNIFKPLDTVQCRTKHQLPLAKTIILFGAVNPSDHRKGGDLLELALSNIKNKNQYAVAVFGKKREDQIGGIETFWLGSISSDQEMAEIYNCADVMCVPSRMDNLPNTAIEATACGVPVVAFNIGGLSDIVEHKMTGYLATPFDSIDFAKGIEWVLGEFQDANTNLRSNSNYIRNRAEKLYNRTIVAESYITVYNKAIQAAD